jgi:hypothetical protein
MRLHRIILLERNIILKGCRIEFGFAKFTTDSNSNRKIILSDYLETVLKYTFTQPNL